MSRLTAFEAVIRGQMDVPEANSLCFRAAGPPALSAALQDLSPEMVNILICAWNADCVDIYFSGSVQQATFHLNDVRLNGLDGLCLFLVCVLLCFGWSFMLVRKAQFLLSGRGFSHVVYCCV